MSNKDVKAPVSLSRRTLLLGGAALATSATFSPMLSFRANATPMAGELQLVPATPNPNGIIDKLFLLKGDPLAGPIKAIVAEDGSPVPAPVLEDGERRVLRVLHFNDMHNHITDLHGKKGDTYRLAQMVKLVKDARANAADNEAVLFVSAGDDHTGSIFDELMGWSTEEFVPMQAIAPIARLALKLPLWAITNSIVVPSCSRRARIRTRLSRCSLPMCILRAI